MPTARAGFGLAVVGGKIYAIGGTDGNDAPLNTVEEYNPSTDQWITKNSMPTPRSGFATAVYDNKIYVIGGTLASGFAANNEVYDPATNSWTYAASMITPRADVCASVINDNIYVIGGKTWSSQSPFYIETDINECYNPVNDSWSTKTSLQTPVMGAASAAVDNTIYVIGGSRVSSGSTSLVNLNQIYDAQNDTWTSPANLKISSVTSYGAAITTQGYLAPQAIYFAGGFTGSEFSNQLKRLNLSNNSWSTLEPMPTPRGYLGLAVVGDILYAIGGFDGTNWLGTNEQYKPIDFGTVAPKIVITSPENKTYQEVSLGFVTNRAISWMGYSLDGQANITISSGLELTNLTQGEHTVVIYANDTAGNMGFSNTVYFSIDMDAPRIAILAPTNQSYDTTDIRLTFTLDEEVMSLQYSLDGQEPQEIIGNITLVALSNGGHYVTVYAIDNLGNSSQETVYFNIAPFPTLLLVAAIVTIIIFVAAGYILIRLRKTNPAKETQS
jgi:N-acetylneuraminic acid mutarotase